MKRGVDVIGSALLLVLTSWVMGLTALCILWKLGSPVLYKQVRIGLNGKPFTMYKFRSMLPERCSNGTVLSNEQRMTNVGRAIRALSLDELPQFFNVLKGDMSLVGPRPLLPQYIPFYTENEARRHEVRPGMTGLAQVAGRNDLPWNDRFLLDVMYVEQQSLILDTIILWKTIWNVVSRSGTEAYPGEKIADLTQDREKSSIGK